MPKLNITSEEKTKTQKRAEFDAMIWQHIMVKSAEAIEQEEADTDSVVHVLAQYLKGLNPGIKAGDLKNAVSDELSVYMEKDS